MIERRHSRVGLVKATWRRPRLRRRLAGRLSRVVAFSDWISETMQVH